MVRSPDIKKFLKSQLGGTLLKFRDWLIEDYRNRGEHLKRIDSTLNNLWYALQATGQDPSKIIIRDEEDPSQIVNIKLPAAELRDMLVRFKLASPEAAPRYTASILHKVRRGLDHPYHHDFIRPQYEAHTNSLQLPPIPAGYIRATRFTDPQASHKIIAGQDFNPGNQTLNTRMDIHQNNNTVLSLVQSGNIGGFVRSTFGKSVLLADLTPDEWRAFSMGKSSLVPNARFVGYIDLQTGKFIPNHAYNPQAPIQIKEIPQGLRRGVNPSTAPIPIPTQSAGPDVW